MAAKHAAEIAELHEARADRKPQPQSDQYNNEHLAPQKIIQEIKHDDFLHLLLLFGQAN